MGMDVIGVRPKSEKGEYFRANVWWWVPLWRFCEEVSEVAQRVKSPHTNDGTGLDEEDAIALAEDLEDAIALGRAKEFETRFEQEKASAPMERCRVCEGTGKSRPAPEVGPGDVLCDGCGGKGMVPPIVTWYSFSEGVAREFAEFLRDCGGFEIW